MSSPNGDAVFFESPHVSVNCNQGFWVPFHMPIVVAVILDKKVSPQEEHPSQFRWTQKGSIHTKKNSLTFMLAMSLGPKVQAVREPV
jgi:hypothetical protein